MLNTKPTENFTGITIQGDFNDFYELVESIYNVTSVENESEGPYYSASMRLLGICYDIRHAYQGDREIELVDNGMNDEIIKYHSMITPKKNVYYSVNVLFPEALFATMAIKDIVSFAGARVGKGKTDEGKHPYSEAAYFRDKANLNVFAAVVWQAFSNVIGDADADKVIQLSLRADESYYEYATQYIDKLNIEYLKTSLDKRKDKLRNIARRIAKKPSAYFKLESDLQYWAKEYNTTIHELHDSSIEYPEEIHW